MQKKALEISLYVVGGGAFAVFLRWLQDQLAFNELGLADRSVFHVLLLVFLAAAAYVFLRFLNRFQEQSIYLPTAFGEALHNEGKLFQIARIGLGVLMGLGAILQIETADGEIARTIRDNTASKDQQILTMDSLQSATSKDAAAGVTYLSIMEENLGVLRTALGG